VPDEAAFDTIEDAVIGTAKPEILP